MSDASASNRFTERLRDAFAERKIAMTVPLANKQLGSGFRPLGEGYEVRIIYRPEGPCSFALEIHSCAESEADDERPDYRLTASRPNRQWFIRVDDEQCMKAYTGERPPVVSMGFVENEDDAWRQIMACVDWYTALPDAVTYALDRLFRRIDAIFGRYACFQAPAGPVDDKTERAPRVLTVHPRRGTTATLRFEPDATRPGSGLMLRICDDANPDPLQGFMARIVTSPGAERQQAVRYDASWMGYDGPRPNISAACETETDLIKTADHLIRFVARHAER